MCFVVSISSSSNDSVCFYLSQVASPVFVNLGPCAWNIWRFVFGQVKWNFAPKLIELNFEKRNIKTVSLLTIWAHKLIIIVQVVSRPPLPLFTTRVLCYSGMLNESHMSSSFHETSKCPRMSVIIFRGVTSAISKNKSLCNSKRITKVVY